MQDLKYDVSFTGEGFLYGPIFIYIKILLLYEYYTDMHFYIFYT